MYQAVRRGGVLVRVVALALVVLCIGSCGGGGGGGNSSPAKVFIADSGNAAIASFADPNPAPGTTPNQRIIMGTSTNGLSPGLTLSALLLDATRDQLYVTNQIAIFVFNNAGSASGSIENSRLLTTAGGGFNSMSLDVARDYLYVGDAASAQVKVFHNASTARQIADAITGAVSPNLPNRSFDFSGVGSNALIVRDVAIDSSKDILYVAVVDAQSASPMSVFVFEGASNLVTGSILPTRTIAITTNALGTMGLFIDTAHDRLYVADSSGGVLIIPSASSANGVPTGTGIALPTPVTRLAVDVANDRLYGASGTNGVYIVPGVSTATGPVPGATVALPAASGNFTAVAVRP